MWLISSLFLSDACLIFIFIAISVHPLPLFSRCGPCKMIAPVFHDLSDEHNGRAQFIKVDVDSNPEAAQKYGVSAMPTFVFVKGGEVVDRLMGANAARLQEVC